MSKTIKKIVWVGSNKSTEKDLLVLLTTPWISLHEMSSDLKENIEKSIPQTHRIFHWLETQYYLPQDFVGIHTLLYGSIDELKELENRSVYSNFSKILSSKPEYKIKTKDYHLVFDCWRLRVIYAEYIINGKCKRDKMILNKYLSFLNRSYAFLRRNDKVKNIEPKAQYIYNVLCNKIYSK